MLSAHKKLNTKWSSTDDLRPGTFGIYKRKIFPILAPFLTAGQAIKRNREHINRTPQMNDLYPGTVIPKYYDDLNDVWVEGGQKKFDDDTRDAERAKEKHAICEAELIILFNDTISESSVTKMQGDTDYFAAMSADNSFRIWKCIERSHDGNHDNFHTICFQTREFINRTCGPDEDFHKFSIDHQLKMRDFATAVESPLHPGFVSLSLLGSVLMIGSLPTAFWEHKIESISESVNDIHADITYPDTIETLQSYHSRHSKTDSVMNTSINSTSNTLAILNTIPPPQQTTSSETIICLECKKKCPKTEMQFHPGQFHKRCKECGIKYAKTKRQEKEKQKEVSTDKPSNLTTVPPPTYLTAEDVNRMIAESRPPTFGSFCPGNYVQSINSQPEHTKVFFFDSCASLSATYNPPESNLLINYRTCPRIILGSYGGLPVEAIGYGYLPHFPVPGIRIYYVPNSNSNVISNGQLAVYGGCRIIQEGCDQEIFNREKVSICKTKINQTTLHHTVPANWIVNSTKTPSYSEKKFIVDLSPNIGQVLGVATQAFPKHWTKEELYRMDLALELHSFLQHRNYSTMKKGLAIRSYGPQCILLPVDIDNLYARNGPCPICFEAKMKHNSIPTESPTSVPTTKPGDIVHMDIQPLPCPSVGGNTQAVCYTDDSSRNMFVNGSKSKEDNDLLRSVDGFVNEANSRGWKVTLIVTDPERCNRSLKAVVGSKHGINIQFVPVDDHEHSAEIHIQIMDNSVTCIRASTPFHIPPKYILNLKVAAATMSNLSPNAALNFSTTPYECWRKQKFIPHATYPYLQVGNTVMSKVGAGHRATEAKETGYPTNQTMKSQEGVILGIDTDTVPASYHVLVASGIVDSRSNVEPVNITPFNWTPKKVLQSSVRQHPAIFDTEDYNQVVTVFNNPPQLMDNSITSTEQHVEETPTQNPKSLLPTDYNVRHNQRPARVTAGSHSDRLNLFIAESLTDDNPILSLNKTAVTEHSLSKALKLPHLQPLIQEAVNKELTKPDLYSAGKIISKEEIPQNAFVADFLFRMKEKFFANGDFEKLNCRMAYNGSQQPVDTYFEIIALTASLPLFLFAFCLLQASAISMNRLSELIFLCFDIPAAFLQGPKLTPTNCPRPMVGHIPANVPHANADKLLLLLRPWYGMVNANNLYDNDCVDTLMKVPGATKSIMDPRKFIWVDSNDNFRKVILSMHVDDGGVISTWDPKVQELLIILTRRYGPLVINNPITSYLSMNITRHASGAYTFSMDNNIQKILEATNMSSVPSISQPARLDAFRIKHDSPPFSPDGIYRTIVGKLIHPTKIRYDIKLSVANVARFTKAPTEHNSKQLMDVLQYLKGTPDLGPTFYTTNGPIYLAECDAAHAVYEGGEDHFGVRHMVGDRNNAPFDTDSRRQLTCVSTAPAGGEFVVLSTTCQKVIIYRNFAAECAFPQRQPTDLYTDCDPAITMATSIELTPKTKIYTAKEGFIRQCVDRGIVKLHHIDGKGNPTDLLAKPTTGADFKMKRNILLNVSANPNFTKYL